jgi:hypothetical protein
VRKKKILGGFLFSIMAITARGHQSSSLQLMGINELPSFMVYLLGIFLNQRIISPRNHNMLSLRRKREHDSRIVSGLPLAIREAIRSFPVVEFAPY